MKKDFILFLRAIIPLTVLFSLPNEGPVRAQAGDSLKSIIARQPDDVEKADNLIMLTKNLYGSNQLDSAMRYCDDAIGLSSRIDYKKGLGDAYYLKSVLCKRNSDFKASLSYTDKYLEIFIGLNDSLRLAKGYFHLGSLLTDMSDYEMARYYCRKSLAYCIPLKDSTIILANYNCLGSIYFNGESKTDSAAFYYMKAIGICEKKNDQKNLGLILRNLGNVYFNNEQYDIALKYFNRSLEIGLKTNNTFLMAGNYNNLGQVAGANGELTDAAGYYVKAEKLFVELKDKRGIADVNNNSGDVYFKLKNYPTAFEKFDKALKIYRDINYPRGIITAILNKAAVYSEQGNIRQSLALQDSCMLFAKKTGDRDLLLFYYRNSSNNFEKIGNYKNALIYQKDYKNAYDSIFSLEKTKSINELVLKYEKEKDQARILTLEKENLQKTYQRNAFMFTIVGILAIALFIFIYFRQKVAHEKIVAEQKILQLEEEKKLMAAKLLVEGQEEERKRIATELHDGLGVLLSATRMQFSIISDKSPENKELIEKATKMLEQASGDVRKISHNMMPGLLTKLGFFEAVGDLFERIDDAGDLRAVCTITGSQERLPENKEIMLYRIVQEMVNNTLKHAKARNIEIRIGELPGLLDISYSDDGKGFDIREKLESDSLGLKSIQSRVNFLNGKMQIESEPGKGVKYTLQVPV